MHLVDTAPMGVTSINERGVVHGDEEFPLTFDLCHGLQWMATSTSTWSPEGEAKP